MKQCRALLFVLGILAGTVVSTVCRHANAVDGGADVIVYGSTPGGVCSAIAAAREGVDVILLEPTDHVGGLNTGGLSHSDSNQCDRSTVMGLFDEWHRRIEKDYADRGITLPYKVSVKNHAIWTYEPHVAARVTKQMLDEAGVRVMTNRYLQSVRMDGTRITEIATSDGAYEAKVFVDATYEGDLLAAADVSWTIGREGRNEFGESYAGKQYPKSPMKINGFDEEGQPLPLVTTTNAGLDEAGDKNVMVYSFRLCLTEDAQNRVPFPAPANYDPARFEIMRRYLRAGGRVGFDLYPLPGNKLDGNNSIGGQFSLGLVGGGNGWCEADEAGRKVIWEVHKQYTLELYHFLTTDSAVPENVRKRYGRLGLCKDEFPEYGHFSPALYVREGRRMRGMYVLSQKDILEDPIKDDPIAISSFPIDSHDCQRVASKEGHVVNEGTIFPVRMKNPKQGFVYHVPYRSILPKPSECTNLLVPVALSCTHVGISSIRVEPTWMILGQSAGIAAALTARDERVEAVQQLPYQTLRRRLLAQGQVLELPTQGNEDASQKNSGKSHRTQVAFPGAEGWGAASRGGRGGRVIKVTNLNASGPGSLAEACAADGPRIVVFEVSGVIRGDIRITKPYLTIAGQTAPGAGITIEGVVSSYDYGVHDIIIRHLRVRPRRASGAGGDCIQLGGLGPGKTGTYNIVLDHLSLSWGNDEVIDLYHAHHVSVQWCTIEESDNQGHSKGPHNFGLISAAEDSGAISVHHNLWAHQSRRVPCLAPYREDAACDFCNNVIYNCRGGYVDDGHGVNAKSSVNLYKNYCRRGPDTQRRMYPYALSPHMSYYVRDNYFEDWGYQDHPRHWNWGGEDAAPKWIQFNRNGQEIDAPAKTPPIQQLDAKAVYDVILAKAGCWPRDRTTQRTVDEVKSKAGAWGRNAPLDPADEWYLSGLTPTSPSTDSDGDGLPDAWEMTHDLDPNDSGDASRIVEADVSLDDRHVGYSYIEFYINELADQLVP